ncbi:cytochrome c/FTR1 family iron permease [Reyranella sp.]|uniref:cytochrome c/FTR1 family iron permease n=1 Tax=Reyranella sp. TaxID=1929291 RepID=UPI00122A0BAC|nr:cytochrome c/FTR1 family iron permease [Reyranella sp.]TAJ81811.1 MAG: c-type cytochrome [Reyranella sp.]
MFTRAITLCVLLIASFIPASAIRADNANVLTVWRLLDYMAIDYRDAVRDGEIINANEYAEMVEFAGTVKDKLDNVPPSSAKADLQKQASELQTAIGRKATPEVVATLARSLAADLIKAYPIPLAPTAVPDYARGRTLYAENCASCHGATGNGKGVASAGLDPAPIAFTDKDRASERSIFALYQVIEQGLDGTSMASFAHLPPQDRWALAFYVGSLAYPPDDVTKGEQVWKSDADLRRRTTLASLVGERPATLVTSLGDDKADAITAYLRRNPAAVVQPSSTSLTLARTRLGEAVLAYEKGDRRAATDLALSAYLDGFEPIEPILSTRNHALMVGIEAGMGELRAAITRGAAVDGIRAQAKALEDLFSDAEAALDPHQATSSSSFFAAFTVLLREGLEAILIVVVMLTLLRKAERHDVVSYVHGGWIAALGAGVLTWAAATYLIAVSGADRELTEGFGSLLAAIVLLWVGVWMHRKSQADAWQRYIRDKLGQAISRESTWGLFGLTFVVVYREVFETILFYTAIWSEEHGWAVIAGAGTAIIVLTAIAWALMRYGRALPVGKFFAYSSALLAVLCVVLIGKGVSALQEAGWLPVSPLAGFIRVEILGIYPTVQGISAQVAMAVLLLIGFWNNQRLASAEPRDPQG